MGGYIRPSEPEMGHAGALCWQSFVPLHGSHGAHVRILEESWCRDCRPCLLLFHLCTKPQKGLLMGESFMAMIVSKHVLMISGCNVLTCVYLLNFTLNQYRSVRESSWYGIDLGYHWCWRKHGRRSLWSVLPENDYLPRLRCSCTWAPHLFSSILSIFIFYQGEPALVWRTTH
jgi:hypothetical protein